MPHAYIQGLDLVTVYLGIYLFSDLTALFEVYFPPQWATTSDVLPQFFFLILSFLAWIPKDCPYFSISHLLVKNCA